MKVLIIKLSSIGDLVHSIPAYKLLEKSFKDKVDWLVYENLAPVLHQPIGENRLIKLRDRKFSTLLKKASELKGQYDFVIDLQGLFKTALISKIIAPEANFGFNKPREDWAKYFYKQGFCDYKSIDSKKHVIEQNLELCSEFINHVSNEKPEAVVDFSIKLNLESHVKKRLCLIPATTWESKHWDLRYWTELINSFDKAKYDFFMTGAPVNHDYLNQIQNLTEPDISIVTDKKLESLYDFYKSMDIVIGIDTGPLHIAAAALYEHRDQKKVIGIYGPSSGSRSGPYGFTAISADEIFNLKATNKKTYLKDANSINKITPNMVLDELNV